MEHFSPAMSFEYGLSTAPRPDSETDTQDLKKRLLSTGFHVQLVKDPTREEVVNLLTDYATLDKLDRPSCFVLIITTHAVLRKHEAVSVLALHDGFITRDELMRPIAASELWRGKPKIFIMQASRAGGKAETGGGPLVRNPSLRSPLKVKSLTLLKNHTCQYFLPFYISQRRQWLRAVWFEMRKWKFSLGKREKTSRTSEFSKKNRLLDKKSIFSLENGKEQLFRASWLFQAN